MEIPETPHYVLKAQETTEIPKNKHKTTANKRVWWIIIGLTLFFVAFDLLLYQGIHGLGASIGLMALYIRYTFPKMKKMNRIVIWSISSLIILVSLIVGDNFLPGEILLIAIPLYLWASFSREHDKILFPVEIQFYDDYLVIYRERKYVIWLTKYFAKEYNKIFYKDVKEAKFAKYPKGALKIYGKIEILRYKYHKDSSIIEKPIFHKTVDAFAYIYTKDSPEVDFVAEIESHSPLTITRDDHFKDWVNRDKTLDDFLNTKDDRLKESNKQEIDADLSADQRRALDEGYGQFVWLNGEAYFTDFTKPHTQKEAVEAVSLYLNNGELPRDFHIYKLLDIKHKKTKNYNGHVIDIIGFTSDMLTNPVKLGTEHLYSKKIPIRHDDLYYKEISSLQEFVETEADRMKDKKDLRRSFILNTITLGLLIWMPTIHLLFLLIPGFGIYLAWEYTTNELKSHKFTRYLARLYIILTFIIGVIHLYLRM